MFLPNWKTILKKAWSIRLLIIAGLLSGLEVILPYFADAIPRGVFSALSLAVICAAFVTRLLAQKTVANKIDARGSTPGIEARIEEAATKGARRACELASGESNE